MKSSNLMRMQVEQAQSSNNSEVEKFKQVQLARRQRLADQILEYKQSVVDAKERKRKTQQDFGRYWRQQMDWNAQTK